MSEYQHILVAIDLHPNCDDKVLSRAAIVAQRFGATLSIVNAVDYVGGYGVAQAYPAVLDIEEDMLVEAKKQMADIAEKHQIPVARQFVEIGSPKTVIINKAQEIGANLIIVGSHGRHGISMLLGSTASSVLQSAACDVLAVRIEHE